MFFSTSRSFLSVILRHEYLTSTVRTTYFTQVTIKKKKVSIKFVEENMCDDGHGSQHLSLGGLK